MSWMFRQFSNSLKAHLRNIRNLCLKIHKLHVNGIRPGFRTRARIIQHISVQDFDLGSGTQKAIENENDDIQPGLDGRHSSSRLSDGV